MTTKPLFDRTKYTHSTLTNFQIVAAYLADIYYNHLYLEANKFKTSGKTKTVTEGYIYACSVLYKVLNYKSKTTYQPKKYEELLTGINDYYHMYTSLTTQTLAECIDRIVREFVPTDFYATLDRDQKRLIIRDAISNVLHQTTKIIIEEYMTLVIDYHNEKANVEAVKERIVDILLEYREKTYLKFSGVSQEEQMDKRLVDKIRNEVNTLRIEKKQLTEQIEQLEGSLNERNEQLMKTITNYKKIEQAYKVAHDQLELREQEVLANMGWHREKEQLIAKLSESQERVLMLNSELNRVKLELEQAKAKPIETVNQSESVSSQAQQTGSSAVQTGSSVSHEAKRSDSASRQGSSVTQTGVQQNESDDEQPKKPRATAAEIAAKLKNSANLIKRTEVKQINDNTEPKSEFTEDETKPVLKQTENNKTLEAKPNSKDSETKPDGKDPEAKPEEIKKIDGPKSKVPKKGAKKKLSLLEAEENILSYDASFD